MTLAHTQFATKELVNGILQLVSSRQSAHYGDVSGSRNSGSYLPTGFWLCPIILGTSRMGILHLRFCVSICSREVTDLGSCEAAKEFAEPLRGCSRN